MITSSALGIIFANVHDNLISELTEKRSMASIPFGGRYRLVDFSLSNLVNAGISKVGLVTKQNYKSLADHIGSGHAYDLARKTGGVYMLTPFSSTDTKVYKGKIDAIGGAMSYLEHAKEEYVVLSNANLVTNFPLDEMIASHIGSGADITVAYKKGETSETYFEIADGKVVSVKSGEPLYENAYLETFVIKKDLLISLIKEALVHNYTDFMEDVFARNIDKIDVNAFEVTGYAKLITNIQEFFKTNQALLSKELREELFKNKDYPIYTKTKDNMPAKYGFNSSAKNSLIADGCVIEGEVENCILFRDVKVGKGAVLKNCIVMQGACIGDNVKLEYVIADNNVNFSEGRTLMGCETFPMVIGKGLTV